MAQDSETSGEFNVNLQTAKGCGLISENSVQHSPVGRLRQALGQWDKLSVNPFIRNVIKEGYKIPLRVTLDVICSDNNKSAKENPSFVSEEIKKLLAKGCISESNSQPHIVNTLTVAYNKKGKPRMVLDCRNINPH